MIIYGVEKTITNVKPDGTATVISRVPELHASGVGILPVEVQEELKNDPTMEDAAPITFGGYGAKVTQEHARDLLTRAELKRLEGAERHHAKGHYAELEVRYGTHDIELIRRMFYYGILGTQTMVGVHGMDRNTGKLIVRFSRRDTPAR